MARSPSSCHKHTRSFNEPNMHIERGNLSGCSSVCCLFFVIFFFLQWKQIAAPSPWHLQCRSSSRLFCFVGCNGLSQNAEDPCSTQSNKWRVSFCRCFWMCSLPNNCVHSSAIRLVLLEYTALNALCECGRHAVH